MGISKQRTTQASAAGLGPHSLLAERAAVAQAAAFCWGCQAAARLCGQRGSARAPGSEGRAVPAGLSAGRENRHVSPSAGDAEHCCGIHDQKEILNLPKTLWLLARRWGQDDPRALKAEERLTANRLRHGSKSSNEKRGRAAQQTDPWHTGTPWSTGVLLPSASPTPVVLARGWEGGLPQLHGEEGPRRGSAPSQLPTATLCPSTGDSDPPHTRPSLAFKLKPRQFV